MILAETNRVNRRVDVYESAVKLNREYSERLCMFVLGLRHKLFRQYCAMVESAMELRLIPEFSGDSTRVVVEWLAKAELVCNLRGIAHLERVVPLRLTGGAFAVYQQLPDADKRDSEKIAKALRTAFLSIHLQHMNNSWEVGCCPEKR